MDFLKNSKALIAWSVLTLLEVKRLISIYTIDELVAVSIWQPDSGDSSIKGFSMMSASWRLKERMFTLDKCIV